MGHLSNARFNLKENIELQKNIRKRQEQSDRDREAHYEKTYAEVDKLEKNRRSLGRKKRSNGKMNKKQRSLDKPEVEILDVDKLVGAPKRKKQQFFRRR